MTTRLYRSSDVGAPVMGYTAGSLNAVLKACLVDGYGALPAAGWSYAVADAATNRAVFTQGASGSNPFNRKVYVRDDEAVAAGSALVKACSGYTTGASPSFTESFCSYNQANWSSILKTSQAAGAVAEWFIVADSRVFLLAVKRHEWKGCGWGLFSVGDYPSPYVKDYGAFAISGRYDGTTAVPIGTPAIAPYLYQTCVFGDTTGTFSFAGLTSDLETGSGTTMGIQNYGFAYGSPEILLTRRILGEGYKLRARAPFIWLPIAPSGYFHATSLPDGYEFAMETGEVLKYLFTNADSVEARIFVQIGGFD